MTARVAMVSVAALLALARTAEARPERVEIRGNVALPSSVYQSAIILSDAARASTATVAAKRKEEVSRAVLDFLLASGYDLATVSATVADDGRLVLDVDEGRLDKIIFLRQGTLRTIELKLSIRLPGDVFNRPLLEQQLRELVESSDVVRADFRVVQVEDVRHGGIQIGEPSLLRRLELLRPGRPHELHIFLEREEENDGLRLGLGIRSPDGFYGALRYDASNTFLSRDRLATEALVGFHLSGEIDTPSNPLGLSRLRLATEWYSPPLADLVTSFLAIDASMFGRQRRDLGVANYYFLPIAASLNVGVQATERLWVSLGGGFEERLLFGVDPLAGETIAPLVDATEQEDLRFFIAGRIAYDFDPESLRLDRRHTVELAGRFLGLGDTQRSKVITKLTASYERIWLFGYDELHLDVNGAHIFGAPFFYDELSIGDGFLRAAFGNDIFLRRAAGVQLEYRISLSREIVKLSMFDDFVVYEGLDGMREPLGIRAATTFGAGLHVLFLDAFQVNAYAGLGIATGREIELGLALSVQRAF